MKIDFKVYQEFGTSKYLLRYSGDINSVKNLFVSGTISTLIDVFIGIFSFVWLFNLDATGGTIVVISSILLYFLLYLINKKIAFYSIEKRNATSGQLSFVNRSFNAILSIKAFNKEITEINKFELKTKNILKHGVKVNFWDIVIKGLIYFLQFGVLVIVFYTFHLTKSIHKTPGALISFILLYITILPILTRLYRVETIYRLGLISLTKINQILNMPHTNNNDGNKLEGEIVKIEAINLKINNSEPINFKLKNESIELILPVTVKTIEFIKVILCISNAYSGMIKINGNILSEYSSKSIRKKIVVISPQLPLIGSTVFESISYSRNTEKIERCQEVLFDVQNRFDLDKSLVLSLFDKIGENGNNLNPIQEELLVIVRAILTNKKIVMVDQLPFIYELNHVALRNLLVDYKLKCIYLK